MTYLSVLVFFTYFAYSTEYAAITPSFLAELALKVLDNYHGNCVELLAHSEQTNAEDKITFRLLKSFSTREITKIYLMDKYDLMKAEEKDLSHTKCFKPIRVVIGNNLSRGPFEKMSRWERTAFKKPITLVLLNSTMEWYFENANLPIDLVTIAVQLVNDDHLELFEVYRIDAGFPLRTEKIGEWTYQSGIRLGTSTIYSRRRDFEGKVFRTGSVENWPLTSFKATMEKDHPWDGFICRVWAELEQILNFTSSHYLSESFGTKDRNGGWTGLMGMIVNNEIDVIVGDTRLEKERLNLLDFIHPLVNSGFQIYYKQPGYKLQWLALFKPLTYDVWIAILLWILAATCCLYLSLNLYAHVSGSNIKRNCGFFDSLFWIFRIFTFQGFTELVPTNISQSIILLAYWVAQVLTATYGGSLISFLTLNVPWRPFDSLEGMLEDGTYKLLVDGNSSDYEFFADASESTLQAIFSKLVVPIPELPNMTTTHYGLRMVCSHDKMALFGVDVMMKMETNGIEDCALLSLTQPLTQVCEGIALSKGNPLTSYIHRYLLKMYQSGLIHRLRNIFMPRQNPVVRSGQPVLIEEVFQIFVTLLLGMIASVIILLVERAVGGSPGRKKRRVVARRINQTDSEVGAD